LHYGSNKSLSVKQFVDALETVMINGLPYRGPHVTNCKDDQLTDGLTD